MGELLGAQNSSGSFPRRQAAPPVGRAALHPERDRRLLDATLLEEIEMTTDLIIAASDSDHALSQAQVDAALGL